MTSAETYVAGRFDALEARFRADVDVDDFRLRRVALLLRDRGCRDVLDLGCGKGRMARRLIEGGLRVVGLDASAGMLASARGVDRVRGSARRLPIASGAFDAAIAVEVFEHLTPAGLDDAIGEMARVVRPGGVAIVVDKNALALDARRPWVPSLAVKRLDEARGRWMYPAGGPFRERWFRPGAMAARLRRRFGRVEVAFPMAPAEAANAVHRRLARARLFVLWAASAPIGGGGR